ncbi:MAG: hypothetical protein HN704_04110 [Bacteroidetes bacterium]|jgi:hypothetical protein|nr:hypothetical protein [Bacteroidota bacterium]MBT6687212.1 hypothetical protein [Bacteroidota bacterium]MBT7144577.1 hypothetical protein [Bacteroidota bacterium]MBT7490777.1 hypothetical protein [Bacteroidota bacterium]
MEAAIGNKLVDSYFRFMRNWDNETKKNLIIKLTQSIDTDDKMKRDFSSCFGAWEDDRNADEIVEDLKADRVNNREIEDFNGLLD